MNAWLWVVGVAGKLPHWLIVAAMFVTLYGPQVYPLLAGTALEPYQTWIAHTVALAVSIVALAKQLKRPEVTAEREEEKKGGADAAGG
jgi:hypothetical protein